MPLSLLFWGPWRKVFKFIGNWDIGLFLSWVSVLPMHACGAWLGAEDVPFLYTNFRALNCFFGQDHEMAGASIK